MPCFFYFIIFIFIYFYFIFFPNIYLLSVFFFFHLLCCVADFLAIFADIDMESDGGLAFEALRTLQQTFDALMDLMHNQTVLCFVHD